jgi:hypothetical protein
MRVAYQQHVETYVTRKALAGAAVLPVLAAHLATLAGSGAAVRVASVDALLDGTSPLGARLASKMKGGFIATVIDVPAAAIFVADDRYVMVPDRKNGKAGTLVKMVTGQKAPAGSIPGPFFVLR